MAEDSRPPPEEPSALPKRTPGAGWLTPGQLRSAGEADVPQQPGPADALPRRSPGASAIQAPPEMTRSRLQRLTGTSDMTAAAAAELAAAAAPRRASPPAQSPADEPSLTARPVAAAVGPATPSEWVPASSPGTVWIVPPQPAGPAIHPRDDRTPTANRRERPRFAARRWQLAGLLVAIIIVIGVVVALVSGHRPAHQHATAAPAGAGNQRLASAPAIRSQTVDWVASQVGHDVTVACDATTCSALAARGFPASSLTVLRPAVLDLHGSELVIATGAVRNQFGNKLAAVYAPQVIASFGAGPARIDVRAMAPDGPAAYRAALSADLAARKSSGTQLLQNSRIAVAASARALLAGGLIDSRLLATIAFLAGQHPIAIVGFGGASPGAGPVPLRSVYLAESDAAAHMTGSAYVQSLESVLHAQHQPYVPLTVVSVRFGGGAPVLEVEFAAPSPLGLLHS